MKQMRLVFTICAGLVLQSVAFGQVNSGSDGSDGEFYPTQNVTINMANHPNGIYQYTSVNIPQNVTVTFVRNANNSPVIWLIQSSCTISGTVNVAGQPTNPNDVALGGAGGPGGYDGGTAGNQPGSGLGPGGGAPDSCASFATAGSTLLDYWGVTFSPGQTYGNAYCLPLIGGSGGGGMLAHFGGFNAHGGGGGGAILIAAPNELVLTGNITAGGGSGTAWGNGECSGPGSGGSVRLLCQQLSGTGVIDVQGGYVGLDNGRPPAVGGSGRVRIDTYQNSFSGQIYGSFTVGFQPIIIPAPGQGVQLSIQSVAGNSVPTNPSGVLANPDVIVPGQQSNPLSIVVRCTNVPLNSDITVTVHPTNGSDVQAVGHNNSGTQSSSTAAVSLNLPRGGGIIYAFVVTGINGANRNADSERSKEKSRSYADTGLTAYGERFAKMEVTAQLGGQQRIAYITESGKKYELGNK